MSYVIVRWASTVTPEDDHREELISLMAKRYSGQILEYPEIPNEQEVALAFRFPSWELGMLFGGKLLNIPYIKKLEVSRG